MSTTKDLERILKPWFSSEERKALVDLYFAVINGAVFPTDLDGLEDVEITQPEPVTGALLHYDGTIWKDTVGLTFDDTTDTLTVSNISVTDLDVTNFTLAGGGTIDAPGLDKEVLFNDNGVVGTRPYFTFEGYATGFLDVSGVNAGTLVNANTSNTSFPYLELLNSATQGSNGFLLGVQTASGLQTILRARAASSSATQGNLALFGTADDSSAQGVGVLKISEADVPPTNAPSQATYLYSYADATQNLEGGLYTVDPQGDSRRLSGPDIPQINRYNASINDYTFIESDHGKHITHTSASPHTYTIPESTSVYFPVGSAITFVNGNGAGNLSIAITTDTMRLAGVGTTGTRTLAANGIATALKISSTEWIISGTGLT